MQLSFQTNMSACGSLLFLYEDDDEQGIKAGMTPSFNFYKSLLLLLERYTIRTGSCCFTEKSVPPPPSFTYTFRRTVRIVGFFCTYYGVMVWDSRCV